jgi:organic radical activating enzyme
MASSYKSELVKIYHSLGRKKKLGTVIFFVTSICNAKCRTCFYWEELNQRGDMTWDEIRKLAFSMPAFSDLWLSGGEPMLRRELTDIIHLFHTHNGVRWVNLPTNGLLPERTAEWTARISEENPERGHGRARRSAGFPSRRAREFCQDARDPRGASTLPAEVSAAARQHQYRDLLGEL